MTDVSERVIIRKRLLEEYLELPGELITLLADDEANNTLELEPMHHNTQMRQLVVPALGEIVMRHDPEFVIGVPNRATWLAGAVAVETGCYLAHLHKNENGTIDYEDAIDKESIVDKLERGVLIDGVSRTLENVRRALAVPGLSEKIVAVVAVWDRNPHSTRRIMPDQPLEALVSEHIPEMLPINSELMELIGSS